MPAIQPARLRHQVAELSQAYRQPDLFTKRLHDMLGLYTDRTHKAGQSGEPKPLMQAYNVPPPVIRQIMTELKPLIQAYPEDSLLLCDLLWQQPYLEFHFLASCILGQYKSDNYVPVMERLNYWLSNSSKDTLIDSILENATSQLRIEGNELLFDWIKESLEADQRFSANHGIRLLTILAREGKLEILPMIFKLVGPYLHNIPGGIRHDLVNLIQELARRTPGETAYILRKNLETEGRSNAAWMIRQALKAFPPDYQTSLRSVMRQQGFKDLEKS